MIEKKMNDVTVIAVDEEALRTAERILKNVKYLWGHEIEWGKMVIASERGVMGAKLKEKPVHLEGFIGEDGNFDGDVIVEYGDRKIVVSSRDEEVMRNLIENDFEISGVEEGPLYYYSVYIGKDSFVARGKRLGTVLQIIHEGEKGIIKHINIEHVTKNNMKIRYDDGEIVIELDYDNIVELDKIYSMYMDLKERFPGIRLHSPAKGVVHAEYKGLRVSNTSPESLTKIIEIVDDYSNSPVNNWQIDEGDVKLLSDKVIECNLRRGNVIMKGVKVEKKSFGRWKLHLHNALIRMGDDVLTARPREVDVLFKLFEKENGVRVKRIIVYSNETVYETVSGEKVTVKNSDKN